MLQMFLSNCTYARIFFPAQAALEALRTLKNTTGHPEKYWVGRGLPLQHWKKPNKKTRWKSGWCLFEVKRDVWVFEAGAKIIQNLYIVSAGRSELIILYINGLKIETVLFNSRSTFLAPRTKTLIPLRFDGHLQGLCQPQKSNLELDHTGSEVSGDALSSDHEKSLARCPSLCCRSCHK